MSIHYHRNCDCGTTNDKRNHLKTIQEGIHTKENRICIVAGKLAVKAFNSGFELREYAQKCFNKARINTEDTEVKEFLLRQSRLALVGLQFGKDLFIGCRANRSDKELFTKEEVFDNEYKRLDLLEQAQFNLLDTINLIDIKDLVEYAEKHKLESVTFAGFGKCSPIAVLLAQRMKNKSTSLKICAVTFNSDLEIKFSPESSNKVERTNFTLASKSSDVKRGTITFQYEKPENLNQYSSTLSLDNATSTIVQNVNKSIVKAVTRSSTIEEYWKKICSEKNELNQETNWETIEVFKVPSATRIESFRYKETGKDSKSEKMCFQIYGSNFDKIIQNKQFIKTCAFKLDENGKVKVTKKELVPEIVQLKKGILILIFKISDDDSHLLTLFSQYIPATHSMRYRYGRPQNLQTWIHNLDPFTLLGTAYMYSQLGTGIRNVKADNKALTGSCKALKDALQKLDELIIDPTWTEKNCKKTIAVKAKYLAHHEKSIIGSSNASGIHPKIMMLQGVERDVDEPEWALLDGDKNLQEDIIKPFQFEFDEEEDIANKYNDALTRLYLLALGLPSKCPSSVNKNFGTREDRILLLVGSFVALMVAGGTITATVLTAGAAAPLLAVGIAEALIALGVTGSVVSGVTAIYFAVLFIYHETFEGIRDSYRLSYHFLIKNAGKKSDFELEKMFIEGGYELNHFAKNKKGEEEIKRFKNIAKQLNKIRTEVAKFTVITIWGMKNCGKSNFMRNVLACPAQSGHENGQKRVEYYLLESSDTESFIFALDCPGIEEIGIENNSLLGRHSSLLFMFSGYGQQMITQQLTHLYKTMARWSTLHLPFVFLNKSDLMCRITKDYKGNDKFKAIMARPAHSETEVESKWVEAVLNSIDGMKDIIEGNGKNTVDDDSKPKEEKNTKIDDALLDSFHFVTTLAPSDPDFDLANFDSEKYKAAKQHILQGNEIRINPEKSSNMRTRLESPLYELWDVETMKERLDTIFKNLEIKSLRENYFANLPKLAPKEVEEAPNDALD